MFVLFLWISVLQYNVNSYCVNNQGNKSVLLGGIFDLLDRLNVKSETGNGEREKGA